jgi:hypothetical protein
MTLAETIYRHSLHLPKQAAQEALDFIEFLEQRYGTIRTAPKSLGDTEAFLGKCSLTAGKRESIKIILFIFQYVSEARWATYLHLMSDYVSCSSCWGVE